MPFFFHPDMKSQYFHYQFLSKGHLNIYQYISDNKTNLPYQDTFNYLPLTYFTFGAINIIISPLQPSGFHDWINNWGIDKYSDPNIAYYLLILKLPYLIFDLLIAYFIYKITLQKKLAFVWLFSPLTIYLVYILGNFDVLPSLLTLVSIYFLKVKRHHLSLLFIGIAISLKFYPLMFLPLYLPFIKDKSKSIIFLLLPLAITVLPFINSSAFFTSFLGSGLTQKLLEQTFLNIPIFPIFYLGIVIYSYFKKIPIYHTIFLIGLLFFSLVKFHPQWIIWFYPFAILTLSNVPQIKIPTLIFSLLLIAYILSINDQFLSFGHLIPVDEAFASVRTVYEIIRFRLGIDPQIFQNSIRLLISSFGLITFYLYEKNNQP